MYHLISFIHTFILDIIACPEWILAPNRFVTQYLLYQPTISPQLWFAVINPQIFGLESASNCIVSSIMPCARELMKSAMKCFPKAFVIQEYKMLHLKTRFQREAFIHIFKVGKSAFMMLHCLQISTFQPVSGGSNHSISTKSNLVSSWS